MAARSDPQRQSRPAGPSSHGPRLHQGTVNWSQVVANGGQFIYIKATQGTYSANPDFAQQYDGSYNAGLIRGAYAFAIPSYSGGAAQADCFASNGGGWLAGTRTLPGALDIEYSPDGRPSRSASHRDRSRRWPRTCARRAVCAPRSRAPAG